MKKSTEKLTGFLDHAAEKTGIDWSVTIETARECCWSIEARITPEPNAKGPDVSTVFFLGGMSNPDQCAAKILPDIKKLFTDKESKLKR